MRNRELRLHRTYRRYPTPAITVSITARIGSIDILHGRVIAPFFFTTTTSSSTPFSVKTMRALSTSDDKLSDLGGLPATVTYRRLNSASNQAVSFHAFAASRARKITDRTMRKMQVPAYCPMVLGAHSWAKMGVEVLEKRVMDISDACMRPPSAVPEVAELPWL